MQTFVRPGRVVATMAVMCIGVLASARTTSAQAPVSRPAGTASAPASVSRDSAGIRIVENARPQWTARSAWTLSPKPVLSIGGGDDPLYRFARVGTATRLQDGRIVVGERADVHLRIYDSTGKHLKTVGKRGSSAGEFTDIGLISRLPGDTLAVESMQYTSVFAPNGDFIRKVTYGPFEPGLLQTPFTAVLGRFDDGSVVVGDLPQGRRGGRGAARWVDSSTLLLVDASGALIRAIDRVPSVSFGANVNAPTRLTFGPELVQASTGGRVLLGFGDAYTLSEYDSSWTLRRIIRRAWKPTPLTTADITTYVDAWMNQWSTDKGAVRERDRLARLNASYPDALPAFVDLLVAPSGEIWLRDPELRGASNCGCLTGVTAAPSRWSVFDSSGRWLGTVQMPQQFTPAEVGRDYVLGSQRDAKDIVRVVMYRIVKPR
ncbi:MAG: hypothetical protein ACO1Q7_13605 [Gemmatimonas sp.]